MRDGRARAGNARQPRRRQPRHRTSPICLRQLDHAGMARFLVKYSMSADAL